LFPLAAKTSINYNSILFRFNLQTPHTRLGLPVGKHILLSFTGQDGQMVSRPYTPVSSDDQLGFFELLIKIYPEGKMGNYLKNLPLLSEVNVRGPQGNIEYQRNGNFVVRRKYKDNPKDLITKKQKISRVGMIAGGTGLTPMLQIIREVLHNPHDRTELSLIFANVAEQDILLRNELDRYATEKKQFKVFYTLDKPPENWPQGKGFVTAQMISQHLPPPGPDNLILVCGPPPMLVAMQKNLDSLDYQEDHVYKY